ncbi:MAG: glycosyltransferase family 4 protein [Solirubrobacteraceae bacterium]
MPRVLHVGRPNDGEVGTALGVLSTLPGYEHERIDFVATPAVVNQVRAMLRRREFAELIRAADIVHVHGVIIHLVYSMLLEQKPTVWSAHGLEASWQKRPRLTRELIVRRSVSNVDVILAGSVAEAEILRSAAPELERRLAVVPRGLWRVKRQPRWRFELRARLGIDDDQITVLLAAGLGDERLALAAVREAREAQADVAVLITGGARDLARVRGRHDEAHVHTLAYEDHPDPFACFAAADVFLVPEPHMDFSFYLIAAMDYGIAIVAGRSRSHDELLGNAALLVPLERQQLAIALLDLIREPGRREYMAGEARRRARQYSVERMRTGVLSAYERALAAHSPQMSARFPRLE